MRLRTSKDNGSKTRPLRASFLKRWGENDHGSTAVEFAMVSIPFLMFVFSAFAIAMHFFTTSALEYGLDEAARKVRTGQAQASGMTNAQFKQEICDSAFLDCNKLQIHVSSNDSWANVSPISCTDGSGNLSNGTGTAGGLIGDQGGCAGRASVITACYEWELAKVVPLLDVGTLTNGNGLIQATTAYRVEPIGVQCP